jgi:serine/threonine protein kinase
MIGQTFNRRYRITSLIGEGGMGEVYLATDKQTRQPVAVKILARQLSAKPEALERFRREAQTLRKLDHPNIVKFVDTFEHKGQYVIVMEYTPGGSLYHLLKTGSLPIERARQISLDLCDALIRAHRLNIIHRDIKPENVLIDRDGTPKLADFGVARLSENTRLTRSGTQVGTPYYMAPEAWEGKMLDAQADIWSLGVMLFEMLAGAVPFNGDTGAAVMNKVLTTEPPDLKKLRPDTPAHLAKVVTRMLTRDREQRFQSMREVALDLERGAVAPVKSGPEKETIGLAEEHVHKDPGEVLSVEGYRLEQSLPVETSNEVRREGQKMPVHIIPRVDEKFVLEHVEVVKGTTTRTLPDWRRTVSNSNLRLIGRLVGGLLIISLLFWGASKLLLNLPATPELTQTSIPLTQTTISLTSELSIGSTMISNKDGMTLVYVPAGEFTMGSDSGDFNEKPIHTVYLDAFWIDQTEVTNAIYAKCVQDSKCVQPKVTTYYNDANYASHPVVYVSWNDAKAYCSWADRRLPTEAEWEKAARGQDGTIYPWGNIFDGKLLNFCDTNCPIFWANPSFDDGYADVAPVGSYPSGKSMYDVLDMAGNVWEWVADWYSNLYYAGSPASNPLGPVSGQYRVLRGGSHQEQSVDVRSSNRDGSEPSLASLDRGFRCGMNATP